MNKLLTLTTFLPLLGALMVLLSWTTARRFLPRGPSALVALTIAFASPVWSSSSRAGR